MCSEFIKYYWLGTHKQTWIKIKFTHQLELNLNSATGSSLFTLVQKSAFYVPANIIHSSVIVLFSLKPDDKSSAFCNPIFSVYLVRSVGFFSISNLWFQICGSFLFYEWHGILTFYQFLALAIGIHATVVCIYVCVLMWESKTACQCNISRRVTLRNLILGMRMPLNE